MIGGVGAWVRDVLNYIDRGKYQFDFLVYGNSDYDYPEAINQKVLSLGSNIIRGASPDHPYAFVRDFKRILRENGPYDVVHSHPHHFSGLILKIARQAGVPQRIAHSHTDFAPYRMKIGWLRRLSRRMMSRWLKLYATGGLAASQAAAADLFGPRWRLDWRWRVLYCGVDLAPFQLAVNPVEVRAELGIPEDALVIGHVGALWEPKNHKFLVEVMAEVSRREPRTYLLLVGDGPLRPIITEQVAQSGLTEKVIFAGYRTDVPRLLRGAMDIFLFPSFFEGLGLALVEAQAAGLMCVFSDIVPQEADVVSTLVRRLSLALPASAWAEEILAAREARGIISQPQALAIVEQSPFNILTSVKELEEYYEPEYSRRSMEL
jgi:glycosyltransferase involved in cell wall biosynthesis